MALQSVEQRSDLVRSELVMLDLRDRLHRVAAGSRATLGHHHELVPAQDRAGVTEVVNLRDELLEPVQSCLLICCQGCSLHWELSRGAAAAQYGAKPTSRN